MHNLPRASALMQLTKQQKESGASRSIFTLGKALTGIAIGALIVSCSEVRNEPYPLDWIAGNTLFTSFQEQPKYLDPVSSYSNNETPWVQQIYEAPLHYHYLKRPYQLEGRSATDVPVPQFLDKNGKPLPETAPSELVAQSVYTIHVKPGILYAPHPAFARDAQGNHVYQALTAKDIDGKYSVWDFKQTGTRELVAEDFVYQIKRLASPYVPTPSPIYGLMEQYIAGLKGLGERLRKERNAAIEGKSPRDRWIPWRDLREVPFEGARAIDDHTYEVRLIGKYPQFRFWLAMSFFAPVPWEADKFYAQRGMLEHSLTFNNWPAGTGPFMLTEQRSNQYVMKRNPNFRGEPYPCEGMPGDKEKGLLDDCGKPMPFADMVVSSIEKERESRASKFIQGYFDVPEIERYDNVFQLLAEKEDGSGRAEQLKSHEVKFSSAVEPQNWYMGFNWLDPVVGKGATPEEEVKHRKLRQAISISTDWEEHGTVFFDIYGPAQVAMSAVPPGMFGYRDAQDGINPITHDWVGGDAKRKSLDVAKKLLAEAGFPDGRDAKSGKPLVVYYDSNGVGPAYQSRLDWQVKQAAKLGIQMEIRSADYNRFQDRMRKGAAQIFFWGWNADYPDAENFLFLLYGPQAKAKFDGENAANYQNDEYDHLYNVMKDLPDGPERQKVIDRMVKIARDDAIWMWGLFPGNVVASQPWMHNATPTIIVRDHVQYMRVEPALRVAKLAQWNKPVWWPVPAALALLLLALWPAWRIWKRREAASARQTALSVIAGVASTPPVPVADQTTSTTHKAAA
jgi:ABC-type transport system substrate-binding protein